MIKIENTKIEGWEPAIRSMRNPMNSWSKSDSYELCGDGDFGSPYFVGPNDQKLMKQLRDAGKDHAKYRRMITVWMDVTGPFYWWKEFETYKVGTVSNSCSTMHKIAAKEFTLDDFSYEHLIEGRPDIFNMFDTPEEPKELGAYRVDFGYSESGDEWWEGQFAMDILRETIEALNGYRKLYLETKDKKYWWQLIQLLPSSYNQKRTIMLNYEVLANIYHARKDHKLDEWHTFCDWAKGLPESWIFTGEDA